MLSFFFFNFQAVLNLKKNVCDSSEISDSGNLGGKCEFDPR